MKAKIKAILFPQPYSNGEYPVYIRIYFNGKSSYIKSGYSIPSGAWNEDEAEVWESMPALTSKKKESLTNEGIISFREKQKGILLLPHAFKINSEIRGIISRLEEIENKLKANEENISIDVIKHIYEGKDKTENARKDFLQYIQKIADQAFQKRQIRTSEKYNVMLKKLKAFRKGKPLPIEELNPGFLNDFQIYLQKDGKHINYIHVNLKALKTIIGKEAIKTDRILSPEKNPFLFFEMPKVLPTKKEKLSIEEIESIEALEITENKINFHVKNIFLFSFYCAGIRIGDLLQLKWLNISGGRLTYYMGKTDKERNLKLLPQALKILKIYEATKEKDSDYIFPFLDNKAEYSKLISPEDFQKAKPELIQFLFDKVESRITICNKGLKDLANEAKINKRLTNHIARHSFADIARRKGISVYDISKLLGHSKTGITERYLSSFDIEAQDKAHESIFSKSEIKSIKEMNPENKPNQQKPNFERIAEVIAPEWDFDNTELFPSEVDSLLGKYQQIWENMNKGKISYPFDSKLLEDLLKKYNLEALLPDFKFMGYLFYYWIEFITMINPNKLDKRIQSFKFEFIQALKFLHKNKKVEIRIKSLGRYTESISIQSSDIIGIIQESLFEYFKKHYFFHSDGYNPENISDWQEELNKSFTVIEAQNPKKGREKGNFQIKKISFILWKYLQDYTDLKADPVKKYSNYQGKLIFGFLEILGLYSKKEDTTKLEDNFGYYLKTYKNR